MRYTSILAAALMVFGFAVSSHAAPAGFKDYKLDGMSIALPSAWVVAPKATLTEIEKKAPGVTVLMAAEGDTDGFPKLSIMRRQQDTFSQDDFVKMDDAAVNGVCEQFKTQMTANPGTTDFLCKRVKAEKGSALHTQFTVSQAGVISTTYMFFQGPKQLTVVSGAVMLKDADKLLPVIEKIIKTVQLGK